MATFWTVVVGAAAGGIGAYVAIRERLAVLDERTKQLRADLDGIRRVLLPAPPPRER